MKSSLLEDDFFVFQEVEDMRKVLVLIMMMLLAGCSTQVENTRYKVGVVQLVQHVALDSATQGFVDELQKELGDDVEIIIENAAGDTANCTIIVDGFIQDGVDLILANATPALQAAYSATGDIPILGTSVTEYGVALDIDNFDGVTGLNVSGTSDLAPLDEQAQMILDLLPDTKTVGILYCSSEANSIYQVKVVKEYLNNKGINVVEESFTDSNDIAMVTADLCNECDAIYIPTDNMAASCAETIYGAMLPYKTPIFTGDEGTCRGCGVATLAISYYELGVETGKMAAEILTNKTDISTMPVRYYNNPVKLYNEDICNELGINIPDDYMPLN